MKVNFIIDEEDYGSIVDSNIMGFMFKKIKDKIEIKQYDIKNLKCDKASINIFFGHINNLLLKYAKTNMFVPNQQTILKENVSIINNFDYIIAKTRYIEEIFKQYVDKGKVFYLSWRSSDISNNYEKEYDQYLLYCYDKKYTNYKKILDCWVPHYPTLNIVNSHLFQCDKKNQENIVIHDNLKQNDFENLFNKCGIHICLNEIDDYSHNINQTCLSKSIPIIVDGGPMRENLNDDICFKVNSKKKSLTKYLGSKYEFNSEHFKTIIEKIKNTSLATLETMSKNVRINALKNHSINDGLFRDFCSNTLIKIRNTPIPKLENIKDEDLPTVSIVTLTHNRKHLFKLSIYNFNTINYPKDKLEWVIYDTSNDDEKIEILLPVLEEREKLNIRYCHNNTTETIGASRNKTYDLCNNDVIVFMDDDDYYPPNSVKNRVTSLLHSKKEIVGCCILGTFDINKYISFVESKSRNINYSKKISPATLCLYKEYFKHNKFSDQSIEECDNFITNYNNFNEISWEDVIISLVHKNNTTYRNVPNLKPNGSHFKFSEKLFKFITSLDD